MCFERLRATEEAPSLEGTPSYPRQPSASIVRSERSKSREQTHSRNAKWHIVLFCLILKRVNCYKIGSTAKTGNTTQVNSSTSI
jgi:hypothetical protein